MTEASKQRMEELASPYTSGQKLVFKAGYQAGMKYPDSNSDKYDQAMKDWSADAIKKTEVIVKLEAENKKLREGKK